MVLIRYYPSQLQAIEAVHELVEAVNFLVGLRLTCFHASTITLSYALLHLFRESLNGRQGVERIMHLLPIHGKVILLAEIFVAKHLHGEVAELYIQAKPPAKLASDFV